MVAPNLAHELLVSSLRDLRQLSQSETCLHRSQRQHVALQTQSGKVTSAAVCAALVDSTTMRFDCESQIGTSQTFLETRESYRWNATTS